MTAGSYFTRFNLSFSALALSVVTLPFSIRICHAGIILFLILWATENNWKDKVRIIRESLLLVLLISLFIVALIGLIYSENKEAGWFVIEKKIFLLLLPVGLATTHQKFSRTDIEALLLMFTMACLAGSVICLIDAITFSESTSVFNDYLRTTTFSEFNPRMPREWMQFSYVSIAEGIGLHPTFFSLYLAFCVIFIYHLLRTASLKRTLRVVFWTLAIYFLLFIICLSSRIIIFSFTFIVLSFVVRELFFSRDKTQGIIVEALMLIFAALLYINPVSRYRNVQEVASTPFTINAHQVQANSIQIRLSLWWLALKSVNMRNVVAGAGTGDVNDIMRQSAKKYYIRNVLDTYDPHNQYLFTLLAHGIIGLIVLALNFVIPVYYNWIQRDYLYLTFAFLFFSVCFTESAFELQKGIVFFALIGSLLLLRVNAFENFRFTGIKLQHVKL